MPYRSADQAAPARYWFTVTPSNTTDLRAGCRGLFVKVAGDVAAVGEDDVVETFTGLAAGTFVPLAVKRVNSTNTTATVIALY